MKPSLTLVPRERSAIIESTQAEIRALKGLRRLSRREIPAAFRDRIDFLTPLAVASAEVVAFDRVELITRVNKHSDLFGLLLKQLAEATKDAKLLVDVIHAAECRLAVALAMSKEGGHHEPR